MYCSHIRCLSLLYVTNKNDYVIHPTIASFESKPHPNDKGSRRHVLRIVQNAGKMAQDLKNCIFHG